MTEKSAERRRVLVLDDEHTRYGAPHTAAANFLDDVERHVNDLLAPLGELFLLGVREGVVRFRRHNHPQLPVPALHLEYVPAEALHLVHVDVDHVSRVARQRDAAAVTVAVDFPQNHRIEHATAFGVVLDGVTADDGESGAERTHDIRVVYGLAITVYGGKFHHLVPLVRLRCPYVQQPLVSPITDGRVRDSVDMVQHEAAGALQRRGDASALVGGELSEVKGLVVSVESFQVPDDVLPPLALPARTQHRVQNQLRLLPRVAAARCR